MLTKISALTNNIKDYLARKLIFKQHSRISKHISNQYFNAFLLLIATNCSEDSINLINKLFSKYGVRSNLLDNSWWLDFVNAATNRDEAESSTFQSRLIDRADKAIKAQDLHYWECMHFYCLSIRLGLFELANSFRTISRDRAVEILKKEAAPNRLVIADAVSALMEKREYEASAFYIKHLREDIPDAAQREWLLKLLTNAHAGSYRVHNESDRYFLDFLGNKSIAIVAPAKVFSSNGELIDSYDIVVRFNHRSASLGEDALHKGMRCDASYFTHILSSYIYDKPDLELLSDWPKDLKWIVLKRQASFSLLKRKLSKVFSKSKAFMPKLRVAEIYDRCLFFGAGRATGGNCLNALPNAILDLKALGINNITVFHADLMLSSERFSNLYNPYQKSSQIERVNDLLRAFSSTHHPETQFWLLSELWKQKAMRGDSIFERVMNLNEISFMQNMQSNYSVYRHKVIEYCLNSFGIKGWSL